jgi:hypothetical protein
MTSYIYLTTNGPARVESKAWNLHIIKVKNTVLTTGIFYHLDFLIHYIVDIVVRYGPCWKSKRVTAGEMSLGALIRRIDQEEGLRGNLVPLRGGLVPKMKIMNDSLGRFEFF